MFSAPKFFRTAHFRLSFLYTLVFSLSVLALGVVTILVTRQFLENQLRAHVEYNASQLMGDYAEDGLDELRHDINERVKADHPERLWYAIARPDGAIEFDPIPRLPEAGWHLIQEPGSNLLLLTIELRDGYRFGVGVGMERMAEISRALRNAFALALLATILIGALGGFVIGRVFLRRVDALKLAAAKIGDGDLSYRLPLGGTGDEFDQLAQIINGMFARIEGLVGEVRAVARSIAHDLRTPLGRMKQKLEGVSETPGLPAGAPERLAEVSGLLDGTLETFAALLRIAEIESGTRRSEFRAIQLGEILDHVASAYEAVLEDGGRSVSFVCEPGLALQGDRQLLIQLLVNLLENVIQHTPRGTAIEVRGARRGGRVELVVADNGPGIAPGERARVLQPFFKLDRSRGDGKGSGLGLSLVAATAKLHDAELSIEDNAPGTRVVVRFR